MIVMPTIEEITFIAVHDFSVCGTVIPKYWFTIQKPESLTCENAVPPQPAILAKKLLERLNQIDSARWPGVEIILPVRPHANVSRKARARKRP